MTTPKWTLKQAWKMVRGLAVDHYTEAVANMEGYEPIDEKESIRIIDRACNAHEELVEALEGLLHRFEAEGYDPPWANVRDARLALQKAREA